VVDRGSIWLTTSPPIIATLSGPRNSVPLPPAKLNGKPPSIAAVISMIGRERSRQAWLMAASQAISQMDELTQQNAALVEQAAAESMQTQAATLSQALAVFKLRAPAKR